MSQQTINTAEKTLRDLDTYAVHGGNLISIELHTLTYKDRHVEEKGRTKHAVREEEERR